MANRDDITYTQTLSPRVALIAAPSTEIVMQDYVDTTRLEEDRFRSMGFPKLLNASGKEDLGGGTIVAITVQQQNNQLAFEPRFTPAVTGTVTTASGPPNILGRTTFTDTAADFTTANVLPGSYMINWTKQSVTDVVRVVDSDTIETRAPQNGSDDEWDIGDSYSLWNITQVRTAGGNLTAVDENGASIPAILPTWGTQVILTTSSSATIQELDEIRFAAYGNGVTLDPSSPNAVSGTDYPAGTLANPSDNWADTLAIGTELGLSTIYLRSGSYTVPASTDLSGNLFILGNGATVTTLTIPDSANTLNLRVQDTTLLNGYLDNANLVERCVLQDTEMGSGFYFQCAFAGTQNMIGTGQINIFECYSAVAGGGPSQTPEFNVNNAIVAGRGWTGGVDFHLKTSTAGFSWDMDSGQVIVDDDNTTGTMTFRGDGTWSNESTYAGTAVVDNDMVNKEKAAEAVWATSITNNTTTGSFGDQVGKRLLTIAKFFGLR